MLHTFSDGSLLTRMSAKELIHIPVWKGNRILDQAHAKKIQEDIGQNIESLDSTVFRIIKYSEMDASNTYVLQKYLIDGQHRAHILRQHFQENLCERDFQVLVIEKRVESESDAIDFFNRLNNVKPQHWNHDPKILANKYISALEKQFNIDKRNPLIRQGTTKRPFLSIDALREVLESNAEELKQSKEHIDLFVTQVSKWNIKAHGELRLKLLNDKEKKNFNIIEAVDKKGFTLAYDVKLPWIKECLNAQPI